MRDGILVVDDNALNLRLIAFVLSTTGHAVRTVATGELALDEIRRSPPRLILMDLQLPGIGGLELTRRLKADPATRAIVIIAVTAYAMKGDDERARAAGCDAYVSKPIDKDALRRLVDQHLRP